MENLDLNSKINRLMGLAHTMSANEYSMIAGGSGSYDTEGDYNASKKELEDALRASLTAAPDNGKQLTMPEKQISVTCDRFDLEQSIMLCWNVVDDIKLLAQSMFDQPVPMSEDEIQNYMLGLEVIYQLKFKKLFETFETLVGENKLS